MIDSLAPYAYSAGLMLITIIVGITTLWVRAADKDTIPQRRVRLTALIVWSATLYCAVRPLDPRWLQVFSLMLWGLMSVLYILAWAFAAPPREPPPTDHDYTHETEIIAAKYRKTAP